MDAQPGQGSQSQVPKKDWKPGLVRDQDSAASFHKANFVEGMIFALRWGALHPWTSPAFLQSSAHPQLWLPKQGEIASPRRALPSHWSAGCPLTVP